MLLLCITKYSNDEKCKDFEAVVKSDLCFTNKQLWAGSHIIQTAQPTTSLVLSQPIGGN